MSLKKYKEEILLFLVLIWIYLIKIMEILILGFNLTINLLTSTDVVDMPKKF